MKQLAMLMTAMAFVAAASAPTWAKGPAVRPAMERARQSAPPPTVNQVLARSWMGEGGRLRDQLAWNDPPVIRDASFDAYVAERAAIRDCQAERYNASRSNLLDGGARPLRDC